MLVRGGSSAYAGTVSWAPAGHSDTPQSFCPNAGQKQWQADLAAFALHSRCAHACRLALRSRFFIHLLAWPWGSIMRGHRLALATTMPLSMDRESLGSPAMSHSRILTGTPSTAVREKVGL